MFICRYVYKPEGYYCSYAWFTLEKELGRYRRLTGKSMVWSKRMGVFESGSSVRFWEHLENTPLQKVVYSPWGI